MKHFWKHHGVNFSMTFLAIFLAMAGMIFLMQGKTQNASARNAVDETPVNEFGVCGVAAQEGRIPDNTYAACDIGTLSGEDLTGDDGIFNRSCNAINPVECFAYKLQTGNTSVTGNIPNGSSFPTNGTHYEIGSTQANGVTGTLSISGITDITVTGLARNGILVPPTIITGTQEATGGSGGIATGMNMLLTIQAGATGGTSLQASGGYFGIELFVASGQIGQIVNIYRSSTGDHRIPNIPDNGCMIDNQRMCKFRTDHLSLFSVGSGLTWDNSRYLDQTFWNTNPSSDHIIRALYGTGGGQTAYIQNRSGRNIGSCDVANMQVTYLTTGTGIPQTLSGNQIYVVNSGTYITTGTIEMSGCSAIIGSGKVTIQGSGTLSSGMIYAVTKSYTIIDNININGITTATKGIWIATGNNNTINNIQTYNNTHGIYITDSSNNTISNTQTYNNTQQGIGMLKGNNNTINNVQTYNNNTYGIRLSSTYSTLNNIESHNNTNGIRILSANNMVNNVQTYNNNQNGISINSGNNTFNTFQSYNNNNGIFIDPIATNNTYYGRLSVFGNTSDVGGSGENLTNAPTANNIGRTAGTSGSNILSRQYFDNPQNMSGAYLLPRSTGYTNLRGRASRSGTDNVQYSIGGSIFGQSKPVKWSGNNIVEYGTDGSTSTTGYGDRNTTKFIATNRDILGGSFTTNNQNGNYTTINGQIYSKTARLDYSHTTPICNYSIFGNFSGALTTGTIFTAGAGGGYVIATTGDGLKTIVLQLRTGTNRAAHYGFNVIIDTNSPTFTALAYSNGNITSGAYYNTTGVLLTYQDPNFSGITVTSTINGTSSTRTYTGTSATGGSLLLTGDGKYVCTITDYANNSTGMTFIIDQTSPIILTTGYDTTLNTSTVLANGNTYTGSNIKVTFNEANLSGISILLNGTPVAYTPTVNTIYTLTGEGQYTITITDKANNSTSTSLNFILQLNATIAITGTTSIANIAYTKASVGFIMTSNKSAIYSITGDIDPNHLPPTATAPYTVTGNTSTTTTFIPTIRLTGGDGNRTLYISIQTGGLSYGTSFMIRLDTTGPIMTLSSPASGEVVNCNGSGTFTLSWAGDDGLYGIGLSGSKYVIIDSAGNTILSGSTGALYAKIPFYALTTSGTYSRYVQGTDKFGRTGNSTTRTFDYVANVDTDPEYFTFNAITNAATNTSYQSNSITITGISPNVNLAASIDNGIMYINGTIVGTTGTVKLGDTVKIALIASDIINETVSSLLTIGTQSSRFRITTVTNSSSSSTLSDTSKLNVATIFNTIVNLYAGNQSKQNEFMTIFQSMVNDQIQILSMTNSTNTNINQNQLPVLTYLSTLIQQYLSSQNITSSNAHKAPNGKIYAITYDTAKACYTSSSFASQNKCFPSLSAINVYIDANNQARAHTVDTNRSTPIYVAPNGKGYTILKTTDNRYFSYRFISPKYFNVLADAKTYINKRNPKGQAR